MVATAVPLFAPQLALVVAMLTFIPETTRQSENVWLPLIGQLLSVTVTVKQCVPVSLIVGVHEKVPIGFCPPAIVNVAPEIILFQESVIVWLGSASCV